MMDELLSDAYELYDSRGGTIDRELYGKAIRVLLGMAFLFLSRGKRVELTQCVSFTPVRRKRSAADMGIAYYQLGYVPDIDISSERYTVKLHKEVKQELITNYENLVL